MGTGVIRAAGVPGRGKNRLINNQLGNLCRSQSWMVCSKSSSVSVGKTQMVSVSMEIPSTLYKRCNYLNKSLYSKTFYNFVPCESQ